MDSSMHVQQTLFSHKLNEMVSIEAVSHSEDKGLTKYTIVKGIAIT